MTLGKTKTPVKRERHPFYLVQRLYASRYKKDTKSPLGTLKSGANPFGYGRMGDYELEYMGAAEFEFGEIPKANNRLAEAGKDLMLDEFEYRGHVFDFLWIGKEGEPFAEWVAWAEGRPIDEYTGEQRKAQPFDGKERPYELEQRLNGEDPPSYNDGEWRTALYWALRGNVVWGFHEDGHMEKWLTSMGTAPHGVPPVMWRNHPNLFVPSANTSRPSPATSPPPLGGRRHDKTSLNEPSFSGPRDICVEQIPERVRRRYRRERVEEAIAVKTLYSTATRSGNVTHRGRHIDTERPSA